MFTKTTEKDIVLMEMKNNEQLRNELEKLKEGYEKEYDSYYNSILNPITERKQELTNLININLKLQINLQKRYLELQTLSETL